MPRLSRVSESPSLPLIASSAATSSPKVSSQSAWKIWVLSLK